MMRLWSILRGHAECCPQGEDADSQRRSIGTSIKAMHVEASRVSAEAKEVQSAAKTTETAASDLLRRMKRDWPK